MLTFPKTIRSVSISPDVLCAGASGTAPVPPIDASTVVPFMILTNGRIESSLTDWILAASVADAKLTAVAFKKSTGVFSNGELTAPLLPSKRTRDPDGLSSIQVAITNHIRIGEKFPR